MNLQENIRRILREDYSPAGKEIIPNSIVVHKSNPIFRDNIMSEGLKVKDGECYKIYVGYGTKCKPAIFATNSINERAWFDSTYDDDIWFIDATIIPDVKWYKDRHFESTKKHIVTFQNIPSEALTLKYEGSERNDFLEESIRRILREEFLNESDPKTGTGKKPKGSDRRLYTDENPSDTVSVKFKTKEDIVDTLNKDSFKSKPHKRQSQIINLIHQRVRAAYQNASDPETKKRLKRGLEYIQNEKEKSKEKTIRLQKEGLHNTSWENDEGDKITLMDLLNTTKDIPVKKVSVNKLKKHLLTWDGDEDEVKKIESADLQYPILIFVEDDGSFISIIDGHHRAQKAVRNDLETIKAKVIPINSLPKDFKKVFGHMGRQEEMKEGELTEKCWAGYTQKGMKTMFGKRYPNCVKKTK